jgi:DHA1 family multidrug resistance protein-like MFS transporter
MLFLGGAFPSVSALIAVYADKKKQGSIYGINTSVASVGMAIGPVIGSAVAALIDFRAVFVAGSIMLAGTVVAMRVVAPWIALSRKNVK